MLLHYIYWHLLWAAGFEWCLWFNCTAKYRRADFDAWMCFLHRSTPPLCTAKSTYLPQENGTRSVFISAVAVDSRALHVCSVFSHFFNCQTLTRVTTMIIKADIKRNMKTKKCKNKNKDKLCKGNIRKKKTYGSEKSKSSTSKEPSVMSCLFILHAIEHPAHRGGYGATSINSCFSQLLAAVGSFRDKDCSTIWPIKKKNQWVMKWKCLICVYQHHKDKGYHFYIILHNWRSVPQVRGALESLFSCH